MRVGWITGGGSGIGRALAAQLCRDGFRVAISGRRPDILLRAASEIEKEYGKGCILALPGDASQPDYVNGAFSTIRQSLGDVELLINGAGVNTFRSFQDTTIQEYVESFSVNCISAIVCAKAVLPTMLELRRGTIVNISSLAGKWASAKSSAYSVAKHALVGFTDSLRQELQPKGVHVMGVYPGYIRTPMIMDRIAPHSLLERLSATPESMAAAILKGIGRKKREVFYPWYVSALLQSHQWLPGPMESLLRVFKI